MKKIIILIMFLMILSVSALEECKDSVPINRECNLISPYLSYCDTYDLDIYHSNGTSFVSDGTITQIGSTGIYNYTANFTYPDTYIIKLCDNSVRTVIAGVTAAVSVSDMEKISNYVWNRSERNLTTPTDYKADISSLATLTNASDIRGDLINIEAGMISNTTEIEAQITQNTSAILNYLVTPRTCYQETANVSTDCGGLDSGTYSPSANWNDGDWSTYSILTQGYVNYTKPVGALNSSKWLVKDEEAGRGAITTNLTIPPNCWSQNPLQLKIGVTEWQCYNGSDWSTLRTVKSIMGAALEFEEAMWWEISTHPAYDWLTIDTNIVNDAELTQNTSAIISNLSTGQTDILGEVDDLEENTTSLLDNLAILQTNVTSIISNSDWGLSNLVAKVWSYVTGYINPAGTTLTANQTLVTIAQNTETGGY